MTIAARTEFPAAERFSARIKSDGEMAGLPDMLALSPLRAGMRQAIHGSPHPCVIRDSFAHSAMSFEELAKALAYARILVLGIFRTF